MSEVERSFELDEELDRKFCEPAEAIGLSPSDALRMFVETFVENRVHRSMQKGHFSQ